MEKFLNKVKENKIIILILILACLVRVIYIAETAISDRQHDVIGENRHLDYILTIYQTNSLPDSNETQFYHPPLHHIISATWLKLVDGIIQEQDVLLESLQCVTLCYSMLLIIVIYKILKELNIKGKYKNIILILMAFHPTFIILSGSINNDLLSILLIFYVMYRLIRWHKCQNIKNTISLAIFTGLAVMAKTSGAIVSIPIIYIFLLDFYRSIKKTKEKKKIIGRYFGLYIIFGIISLSIGLWYPIRNYILFNQPILYVLDPNSESLYVGNYSLLSRLLPISSEIFTQFGNTSTDYNIPTFLLKSSLFGEWEWGYSQIGEILYCLALYSNIIVVVISLYSMIKVMISKRKNKRNIVFNNLFFLLYITNIISFILMNIKLPYGCSMDFRYIVPSIFVGAYFIVEYLKSIKKATKREMLELFFVIFSIVLIVASDVILIF